jgi:hypothetical protein
MTATLFSQLLPRTVYQETSTKNQFLNFNKSLTKHLGQTAGTITNNLNTNHGHGQSYIKNVQ